MEKITKKSLISTNTDKVMWKILNNIHRQNLMYLIIIAVICNIL